jgi:hypothetical protein
MISDLWNLLAAGGSELTLFLGGAPLSNPE